MVRDLSVTTWKNGYQENADASGSPPSSKLTQTEANEIKDAHCTYTDTGYYLQRGSTPSPRTRSRGPTRPEEHGHRDPHGWAQGRDPPWQTRTQTLLPWPEATRREVKRRFTRCPASTSAAGGPAPPGAQPSAGAGSSV